MVSVLPPFAGSGTKVIPWLAQYRAQVKGGLAVDANDAAVDAACKAKFAQNCVPKNWEVLSANGTMDKAWTQIVEDLMALYVSADAAGSALTELQRRRQGDGESVMAFYESYVVLAKDAGVDIATWKDHFMQALKPSIYAAIGLQAMPHLVDVLKMAGMAERMQESTRASVTAAERPLAAMAAEELVDEVAAAFQRGRESVTRSRTGGDGNGAAFRGACFNCGATGHKKAECKKPRKARYKPSLSGSNSTYNYSTTKLVMATEAAQRGPSVRLWLAGMPCDAVIDTGSARSLVSAEFARRSGLQITGSTGVSLVSANRQPIKVSGVCTVTATMGNMPFQLELIIVGELVCDMLLGRDFVQRHRVVLDIAGERVSIQHRSGKSVVRPYSVVSKAVPLFEDPSEVCSVNVQDLPTEQRPKWEALEAEFGSCFAQSKAQYALAKVDPMIIRLKGDPVPIRRRPYRSSMPEREAINAQCREWLANGIIRPSKSQWAAPAKMVAKDDLSGRLVVDFSGLGRVTEDDPFPTPYSQSIFDAMAGRGMFSVCDLQHAYLQVPVAEESRYLLSFVTEDGQYEFCRVPFGFKNSGAALQRALNAALGDIDSLFGYADDWMVATKTWDQHWSTVRRFLQRIREAGFLLKPTKCQIGLEKVKFLGRIISKDGVHVQSSGVEAVLKIPAPTSSAELRVFLGGFQWFSQFIVGFSAMCAPLNKLRSEKTPWQWGPEQQKAFEDLRLALTRAPVLRHPDFAKPFVVETDASGVAVGAVLMQEGHPVAYAGRCLKPAEIQLGITALELTAVIFAVEHWHVYLHGPRPFTLVTDHKSLQWLKDSKNLSGKLAQWALILQGYNFEVRHRAGATQGLSDTISRAIVGAVSIVRAPAIVEAKELVAAQAEDRDCARCLRLLREARDGEKGEIARQYIVDPEGVLCLLVNRFQRQTFRQWIPEPLVTRVLEAHHDRDGHLGADATFKKVKELYFWPRMQADVRDYVARCGACQHRKPPPPNRELLKGSVPARCFNDMVALDVLTGLKTAAGGFQHILVMMDYFSRFAMAVPMRTKTAEEVTACYQSAWVGAFGPPTHLLSDQGPEFTSRVFSGAVAATGTTKEWTSPYTPQTDGLVERFNRTLAAMLATSCGAEEEAWTTHLGRCVHGYNSTPNGITGVSPFFTVFVAEPVRVVPVPVQPEVGEREISAELVREKVQAEHAARDKAVADRNHHLIRPVTYRVGQHVLVRDQAIRQGAFRKLASEWEGPFKVLKKPTMYTYLVIPVRGGNAKTVNARDVKEFKTPKDAVGDSKNATGSANREELPAPKFSGNYGNIMVQVQESPAEQKSASGGPPAPAGPPLLSPPPRTSTYTSNTTALRSPPRSHQVTAADSALCRPQVPAPPAYGPARGSIPAPSFAPGVVPAQPATDGQRAAATRALGDVMVKLRNSGQVSAKTADEEKAAPVRSSGRETRVPDRYK